MASYTTLRNGSRGSEVQQLQNALINAGYSVGSAGADGIYGKGTAAAVKAYQSANGLTVDGIAGNQTLGKLYGSSGSTGTGTSSNPMKEAIDKQMKEYTDRDITQFNEIKDKEAAEVEKIYNQQILNSDASYEKIYDQANVQKYINEAFAAEHAANMGQSKSGYNRNRQTQIQLAYGNAVLETDLQKTAAANSIRQQLAEYKVGVESQKSQYALETTQKYDILGQESYNEQYAAEQERIAREYAARQEAAAKVEAARISAAQKQAEADAENKKVVVSQIKNFESMIIDEDTFNASPRVTRGNRGNVGNGGYTYKGKTYIDYKDYIEASLDTAYNNGIINEGTYRYLLTEVYQIY